MATQSRARMFYGTAKALNSVAAQRLDDPMHSMAGGGAAVAAAPMTALVSADVDAELAKLAGVELPLEPVTGADDAWRIRLGGLRAEFRWAESKLMQASERLAEAQEARRKDLVALACMRRELRGSFTTERAWVEAQQELFTERALVCAERERSLAEVLEMGAATGPVVHELAVVRTERKLHELAAGQAAAQLARIADNDATLEFEVASEAYDREPDGRSMRELARLRTQQARDHRAAVEARATAATLLEELGFDPAHGELSAVAAFLAAEVEGDERAEGRMQGVRRDQVARELELLPEPTSAWKAGLRHPVGWLRARRTVE